MTVQNTTRFVRANGDGAVVEFQFSFPAKLTTDVTVKKIINSTGTATTQTVGVDYTITLNSVTEGGTITYTVAPTALEDSFITRETTQDQQTALPIGGNFPEISVENEIDRSRMIDIELQEQIGRSIVISDTETLTGVNAPMGSSAANRALKTWAWNSAGTGLSLGDSVGLFQGDWLTATDYVVRDLIKDTTNDNIYFCNTAHTSSGGLPISTNGDVAKWDLLVDAEAASDSAAAALVSETNAATSETNAATSETNAAISEALTDADAIATAADAVSTGDDVTSTNADVVITNADVVSTNADVVSTNADVASTNADVVTTTGQVGAVALKYTFSDTTTMADPTTGKVRLNNAALASVTAIAFDATSADTGNPDVSDFLASLGNSSNRPHRGTITIKKSNSPATFATYSITGAVVDNTGWLQFAVTFVDSNGTLTDADTLYFSFTRTGNSNSVEGTEVLSTGETGGNKFLREDGDDTSSWQEVASGGSWELLQTQTASASASIDFDAKFSVTFDLYMVVFKEIIPSTDNVHMIMRLDADGGVSFDAGASDYKWTTVQSVDTGTITGAGSSGDTEIQLMIASIGNGTGEGLDGRLFIYDPFNSGKHTRTESRLIQENQNNNQISNTNSGKRSTDQADDSIQFLMDSGNIASGTFELYGLRK